MKITVLSDTHGKHRELCIEPCDILIHAGDCCDAGDIEQMQDFFMWLSDQPARYKIFVSGNHDLPFELDPEFAEGLIPDNVLFLNNRSVEIEGVTIAGIEATMGLLNDIEITENVDIIISHCAPKDILDGGIGCDNLRKLIFDVKPTYSIFGHCHEFGDQQLEIDGICFMNVATAL
ncbi:MAG: metallophosphatase domain-containing protein [Rikenellaceae bacterium]